MWPAVPEQSDLEQSDLEQSDLEQSDLEQSDLEQSDPVPTVTGRGVKETPERESQC